MGIGKLNSKNNSKKLMKTIEKISNYPQNNIKLNVNLIYPLVLHTSIQLPDCLRSHLTSLTTAILTCSGMKGLFWSSAQIYLQASARLLVVNIPPSFHLDHFHPPNDSDPCRTTRMINMKNQQRRKILSEWICTWQNVRSGFPLTVTYQMFCKCRRVKCRAFSM